MTETEMDRDEFYTDFLQPQGLRYYISSTLAKCGRSHANLYIHRTAAQGHVSDEDIAIISQIQPHVATSFDIFQRLNSNSVWQVAIEDTLDLLDFGAIILNQSGAVAFANQAAREILADDKTISTSNGELVFECSSANRAFGEVLTKIFNGSLDSQWAWGGDIHVPRASGSVGYLVSVRRLPNTIKELTDGTTGSVVVFIVDPLRKLRFAADALSVLYGLTDAETEVAWTFAEVADRRGVSLSTTRTQLKHIRQKLNIRSQTELLRFLHSLRIPVN
jgi:DNA-binding CsgD family transcriptional regulator